MKKHNYINHYTMRTVLIHTLRRMVPRIRPCRVIPSKQVNSTRPPPNIRITWAYSTLRIKCIICNWLIKYLGHLLWKANRDESPPSFRFFLSWRSFLPFLKKNQHKKLYKLQGGTFILWHVCSGGAGDVSIEFCPAKVVVFVVHRNGEIETENTNVL